MSDDKPFVCPVADCGMRFISEDHLSVHSKKHEMSLALNAGPQSSNSPAHHFLDQTPTPTKFLKNCEEIGLFQELTQNPFDHAYKKALDNDPPIPGPQTGELNTPTLILSDSLKNSSTSGAAAPSPLSLEKTKSTEPLKPSPLAKTTSASKLVLDLSGKSVMTAQPSSTKSTTVAAIKRNLASEAGDITSIANSVVNQVMTVGTTPHVVTRAISSSQLSAQAESSQHSAISLANIQSQLLASAAVAPSVIKQEVMSQSEVAVKKEDASGVGEGNGEFMEQQPQQCTMQVLLQLPTGETVPISIPATINKLQYQGVTQAAQTTQLQQSSIYHSQPQQQQQQQQPTLQPAPSKTVASSLSTTLALKQRLKAQLQSQLSPTAKAAEVSLAASNAAVVVTNAATPSSVSGQVLVGSPSPIMMVDSPSSEMNLSDSSDYSVEGKRQKMSPETGDPEERRRKFLERNRAAAARCRQKRKHWISNLEKKADELQSTNMKLQSEVKLLRGEVAQLKTLLLAHKDCPVTQQQRSQGQLQHIILTDGSHSSQDLAQVVPTADMTSEPLQIGQTIVTFLRESVVTHQEELERGNE